MRRTTWTRLLHYEFWPFWFFYIPAYFYYFILAIKSRRWIYFSVLNRCMNFGGAFLSSKSAYLQQLPQQWIPKTVLVNPDEGLSNLERKIENDGITYPLIVKPDMGERGKGVEIIHQPSELNTYLLHHPQQSLLIQEYIDYPIELGILFYWDLHGKPQISSIGEKSFCSVIGNGKDSLKTIIKKNPRLVSRVPFLKEKFKTEWEKVLPKGKTLLIEPIGNHNRGTTFLDGRKYYSKELLQWIANCATHIPHFDYGRFDLKIQHWDAFKMNKGIKIMEINGVNSEPIHIYDPNYSLWKAYRDIFHQMRVIFELSQKKINEKEQTQSLLEFIRGSQLVLNRKPYS
ncbi:MAG: ATP-grasp domain-containing protein [Flavobacteriales bacterium]|jgi:hypothetical protein|nr:ATP-grasp domain-containing protein [Flavobacteriales bacterium]